MICNFYKDLKGSNSDRKVPKGVIKELNKELPKGYYYEYDEIRKHLVIKGTTFKKQNESMDVTINLEEEGIPNNIPQDKIPEYLYRTQKSVKLNNAVVRQDGKELRIDDMNVDPLSGEGHDETIIQYLYPAEFPPAAPMNFQTEDRTKQVIMFRRQPYDRFDAVKFANESFPALKVEWIISERFSKRGDGVTSDNPLLKISVTPKDAESVSDAVIALKIFKGYIDGTLVMEGTKLGRNLSNDINFDLEALDDRLRLWQDLEKLEGILNVRFQPSADISEKDREFLAELRQMFIQEQDIIHKEPFSHFHLGQMIFSGKNMSEKDLINKENMSFTFINEIKNKTLLGTELDLYETVLLTGFTIIDVVKDEEKGNSGCEVYIKRSGDAPWRLIRRYSQTYDAARKHMERMRSYKTV